MIRRCGQHKKAFILQSIGIGKSENNIVKTISIRNSRNSLHGMIIVSQILCK